LIALIALFAFESLPSNLFFAPLWSRPNFLTTMSDLTLAEPQEPASRQFESIATRPTSYTLTRTHTNGSRVSRSNTKGSQINRTSTHQSHKEARDPNLDVNLPYRTLSNAADFTEYTREKASGEIVHPGSDGKPEYKLVTFLPDDPENPKNWSKAYKWYCTMVVALTCFVVAFASSVVTADIPGVMKEFGRVEEIALISVSIFVVGFGLGMFFCQKKVLQLGTDGLFRPYGLRTTFGSSWTQNHLRNNTSAGSYLHHSLRPSTEYSNAPRLPCHRWYRVFSTYDTRWRHPR
jgi:hypothetical protein